MYGGGWCWVPGPIVVRPVYSPALVVFVGGPRFGISLSIGGGGGVGWFPLGPREVYVPPYRSSVRYVQNVNITNTTVNVVNVTNIYNNRDVSRVTYMHRENAGAVTVVSRDTFVNARAVGGAAVRVDPRQLHDAEIQRGVAVAPVRQSVVGSGAIATVRPPQAAMNRQVVVKQAPAPPPVSFQRRQQVLSAQPGSAPTQQQMDRIRAQQAQQQPAVKIAPPVQPNVNQPATGRFPTQQQNDSRRGQQGQQQPPPNAAQPGQPNVNQPQPGRVPDAAAIGSTARAARAAGATAAPGDFRSAKPAKRESAAAGPRPDAAAKRFKARTTSATTAASDFRSIEPAKHKSTAAGPRTDAAAKRFKARQQVQQQPPAISAQPNQPNTNQPQPGRVPAQAQTDQRRGQQQPPVVYAPPARVKSGHLSPASI